jgi:hypothetical protein
MGVVTIYRLAESCLSLIEGGDFAEGSSLTFNEIKIACGNVINSLLKTEYFSINEKMGEKIPNGAVSAFYTGIPVYSINSKSSKANLPIKPLKLPRNMGVWDIMPSSESVSIEFVPLQLGQIKLKKSQPMLSNLLGQCGYEVHGMEIIFDQPIHSMGISTLDMRLIVMDISQYGDFDPLPILPEQEWEVINQVYKLYTTQPTPDKLVDPTVDESKGNPVNQQKASQ